MLGSAARAFLRRRLPRNSAQPAPTEAVYPDWKTASAAKELRRRPHRAPDLASENYALIELAKHMASSPESILQKLSDTAFHLCKAESAGVSLLEETGETRNLNWRAITGTWADNLGGGTPRDLGPGVTVLHCDAPLLFSHPGRDFPYLSDVPPRVDEGLLVPFYLRGEPIGTIWVVHHDQSRQFNSEDLRILKNLGTFASAAYQSFLAVTASQQIVSIVDSSDDAIISKNLAGIIATWNPGATRLFGYAPEEIIGKSVTILIPPDRQHEEGMIIERVGRGERVDHYETIRRRKDGSLVEISLTVSPVRDSGGWIVGASKIARDISERKQREEHIALLAGEMDHRAKNLLSLVQATVRLAQGETPAAVKMAIAGRIRALSNAHGLLAQSRWLGADIRTLIAAELSPYALGADTRAELVGPVIMLKPRMAQALAVALHELTTNAVKYGALSVAAGRVRVQWSQAPEGTLVIQWTEAHGPAVVPPTNRGFGLQLVGQIFPADSNATARFDWRTEGLYCELTVDLSEEL